MKIQKTAVYFDETEIMELHAIVLDEDKVAALEFLKNLSKRIDAQQRSPCGSKIVRGN